VARPIPDPEPVINAIFPSSLPISGSLHLIRRAKLSAAPPERYSI
jgi:hypothetical protein